MSKFKVNDRVVVDCDFFPNLQGKHGTVVHIQPKSPISMEMFDVELDDPARIKTIPFFVHELRLL